MADLAALGGTALVTSAYVFLAMNLMPWGPTAIMVKATEAHKKWGDRAFQNTMEHAPLFLAALWTHAIFVSAEAATAMGWVYVALRACYPVVWAVVGGQAQPVLDARTTAERLALALRRLEALCDGLAAEGG